MLAILDVQVYLIRGEPKKTALELVLDQVDHGEYKPKDEKEDHQASEYEDNIAPYLREVDDRANNKGNEHVDNDEPADKDILFFSPVLTLFPFNIVFQALRSPRKVINSAEGV